MASFSSASEEEQVCSKKASPKKSAITAIHTQSTSPTKSLSNGKTSVEVSSSESLVENCNYSPNASMLNRKSYEQPFETDNNKEIVENPKLNCGDGSDSGCDIGIGARATLMAVAGSTPTVLQRALSNNSGGYASSCCGGNDDPVGGVPSCNSSMISYSSDIGEMKNVNTVLRQCSNYDCTSEGGSESSSITGGPTSKRFSVIRKKVAVNEPVQLKSPRKSTENSVAKSRSRAASANRSAAQTKCTTGAPNLATHERARSREKGNLSILASPKQSIPQSRSTPLKRPNKPDTLPTGIGRDSSVSSPSRNQRNTIVRAGSVTRGRTPGGGNTPNVEDGRWPSVSAKVSTLQSKSNHCNANANRATSVTPENIIVKTKFGPLSLNDKFATLPRRRKEKSNDEIRNIRSSSVSRDRMTQSFIRKQSSFQTPTSSKTLPRTRPKITSTPKIKIYHEISSQTAITCKDVEDAFAGVAKSINVSAVDVISRGNQVDIRDRELERLMEKVHSLKTDQVRLQGTLSERCQMLANLEHQMCREREEKLAMQRELQSNTERILGMLELVHAVQPNSDPTTTATNEQNCDSLLMLESQIQMSGHVLEEKQDEIDKLRSFCNKLQIEMQRSISVQHSLLEEKQVFEQETIELQDFLQDEKTALVDALNDAEAENERRKNVIDQKDHDIERLQEECRHLVRISEQRRQENLGMQSKYTALESRSKELIVQQSTAVSGAAMALSSLNARLDHLVEQLVSSYNISEQELEDIIYHNEAYTNSPSSEDVSPEYEMPGGIDNFSSFGKSHPSDGSLSPQRNQSFIVAVINAIKGATTHKMNSSQTNGDGGQKKRMNLSKNNGQSNGRSMNGTNQTTGDDSDSTEMLDSETEPCLMMENVLEDVSMPDSHSHNMVSSTAAAGLMLSSQMTGDMVTQPPTPSIMNRDEESMHNLSQAIVNRQQIEFHASRIMRHNSEHNSLSEDLSIHESIADMPSISDYCSAQALVDQVIDVDNLVTKLLKVLRIIQMDNDNCIQQLITDKNKLQLNKEDILEKLRDWESLNEKLQNDLKNASQEIIAKGCDLTNCKVELQKHRAEIDRLNEDICNLSTLCSQKAITKEDIINTIKLCQENEGSPEPEILAQILSACQEIPVLKEKLSNQNDWQQKVSPSERRYSGLNLSANCKEAISESKRQYDAIERALDILNNIQSSGHVLPQLTDLQKFLEETNFQSLSNISNYTALLAASNTNTTNSLDANDSTSDCNANASATTVQNKFDDSDNNVVAIN